MVSFHHSPTLTHRFHQSSWTQAGLIKEIGISNCNASQVRRAQAEALKHGRRIAANQVGWMVILYGTSADFHGKYLGKLYQKKDDAHNPDPQNIQNSSEKNHQIPSGERLHSNGKIHHAIHGKIHYFDWAIFHGKLLVHQRVYGTSPDFHGKYLGFFQRIDEDFGMFFQHLRIHFSASNESLRGVLRWFSPPEMDVAAMEVGKNRTQVMFNLLCFNSPELQVSCPKSAETFFWIIL